MAFAREIPKHRLKSGVCEWVELEGKVKIEMDYLLYSQDVHDLKIAQEDGECT